MQSIQKTLAKIEEDLKRRKFKSSHIVAEKITQFFYDYIKSEMWGQSPANLLEEVREIGATLT